MPLREECLENLAEDIDQSVGPLTMDNRNKPVEDIYNQFLDDLDHYEFNFWTINHDIDEITERERNLLATYYIRTGLIPMIDGAFSIPLDDHHWDLMLKHYYKQVCIETKVWVCELIQDKLNKV